MSLFIYVFIFQILKELILNLHYPDEDQKSEIIVYSYQVIEKMILWFEKKNLQHILQLAVYAGVNNSIQFSLVEDKSTTYIYEYLVSTHTMIIII